MVLALLLSSFSLVYANKDSDETAKITGRATQTLFISFDTAGMPTNEQKELLLKGGWKYNNKGFYKIYPDKLGTIEYDNNKVTVDDEGYFSIEIKGEYKEELLKLDGYDKNQFKIDNKNLKSGSNYVMLDNLVDFQDFATRHIEPEENIDYFSARATAIRLWASPVHIMSITF